MPVEYGFLKYGKPLVAAAPILIGLNLLPSTVAACTGATNDPQHCVNNDGQIIDGFNDFYNDNLSGIPGATTVPGDTGTLYPGISALIDGSTPGTTGGLFPGLVEGSAVVTNTSIGVGTPLGTPGVGGTPQLPTSQVPNPSLPRQNPLVNYYVTSPDYAEGNQVIIDPESGTVDFGDGDVEISPEALELLVDDDDAGPAFTGDCQSNLQACEQQVSDFYIQVAPALADQYSSQIFDAAEFVVDDDDAGANLSRFFVFDQRSDFEQDGELANALVESLKEEFGTKVGISGDGFDVVNDDDNDIYSSLRSGRSFGDGNEAPDFYSSTSLQILDNIEIEPSTPTPAPAESSNQGADFAEEKLNGLQRLRDRAAAETDPQKKQELQARVERFEKLINSFGSSAIRAGLHNQDTLTTPVPGRN